MIILGIDPGFGRLGYAVIKKDKGELIPIEYGIVETKKGSSIPLRLGEIYSKMLELIEHHRPNCIVTEKQIFAANRTTAFDVAKALGVVLLASNETGIDWIEYTPNEIKLTVTGSGSADKNQIQYMVSKLLKLKVSPKPDDVSDALAVAICHAHQEKMKRL